MHPRMTVSFLNGVSATGQPILFGTERIKQIQELKESEENRQEILQERGETSLAVRDAGRVDEKDPHEDVRQVEIEFPALNGSLSCGSVMSPSAP
jgi:hypothetical protein